MTRRLDMGRRQSFELLHRKAGGVPGPGARRGPAYGSGQGGFASFISRPLPPAGPRRERNLLLLGNVITPDNARKLLPMSPVCFVTYVAGCTISFFSTFFRKRSQ